MSARRKSAETYGLVPPVPRGEDRRSEIRDSKDWRVNPRSYEFCGAVFDPLTPAQTLARCKWVTAPTHTIRRAYLTIPTHWAVSDVRHA